MKTDELAGMVRDYLAAHSGEYSTIELCNALGRPWSSPATISAVAKKLARMAPHMPDVATHDGEIVKRFGREWRRWRWHGTK